MNLSFIIDGYYKVLQADFKAAEKWEEIFFLVTSSRWQKLPIMTNLQLSSNW